MKTITIYSKKWGDRLAYVDDEDYDLVMQFRWNLRRHLNKDGSYCCYASTWNKDKPRKQISMHRLILGLTDPSILCDHIDRNGLNNQRHNLRRATYGENSQNKGVCRRNESGFKGVVMNKENRYRKYCAVIIANGKRIFGGGFKTPEEAAIRWNELARKYHGEFAYQNQL